MGSVIIFGNAQLAELAHFYLTHDSSYDVVAFTVDETYLTSTSFCGLPVVAFEEIESEFPPRDFLMLLPLGTRRVNRFRAERYQMALAKGYRLTSYVSSKANVAPGLEIGKNAWIDAGCTISPFAYIGNNVCIGSGCVVGHHATIEDHCFIGAGSIILGNSSIGKFTVIGAGSTIQANIYVGEGCIIDAEIYVKRSVDKNELLLNRAGTK